MAMRRVLAAICLMPLAICAVAGQPAAGRAGYAFESSRVIAQQRLFGIAHGILLLATACRVVPESAQSAQEAYANWRSRQQSAIDLAAADMSAYHFGATAEWATLARQLQLRAALDYAPDSPELKAACATLPQALARPRYDLAGRFRLEELMARVVAAAEIEAHEHFCRKKLSGLPRRILKLRYHLWHEINDQALDESTAALERDWPAEAPAATFADWQATLRSQPGGSEADCIEFSESLKRPERALRNVFQLPPAAPRPSSR